jgi:hypothetical protein
MKKAGYPLAWSPNGPVPRIVAGVGTEHISCMAVLDPQQPYLDHHRPGGDPLLGTVMGIEAMARAVRLLQPEGWISRISDVEIGPPCILNDGELLPRRVRVDADTEGTIVCCKVMPEAHDDSPELHFAARFLVSHEPPPDGDRIDPVCTFQGARVTANDVYALFFHGPWFQVVAEAGMLNGALIARSAFGQHDLFDSSHYEVGPRSIEFCLQAAGLLELAETGRMMIPHAIRRIERLNVIDESASDRLVAIARRSEKPEGSSPEVNGIDVDAIDAKGRLLMRLTGYETYPLPFAVEHSTALRLQELLRRSPE